jgi:hypothetical protein
MFEITICDLKRGKRNHFPQHLLKSHEAGAGVAQIPWLGLYGAG